MSIARKILMGSGGKKDSTYIDDVFSTYLYKGTNGANTVNTGLDMSGEGGLLWVKSRSNRSHQWFDTVRGVNKHIHSDTTAAEVTDSNMNQTFTSTGFTFNNTYTDLNDINGNYASWNFRKQKGFFDIVTYTGNGTAGRQLPHNLGCAPGMVAIKCTSDSHNWTVWHRGLSSNAKVLKLNDSSAEFNSDDFNGAAPSSTVIHLASTNNSNAAGKTYVAYLWAGGESTAATARSVAFSSTGVNDGAKSLTIAGSSGTNFGSGDFTMECWFKDTRTSDTTGLDTIFAMSDYTSSSSNNSFSIYSKEGGFQIFNRTGGSFSTLINTTPNGLFTQTGIWHHFAWTRSGSGSNNNTLWVDGSVHGTFTNTLSYTDGQNFYIGGNNYSNTGTPNEYGFNGNISNVRLIKGQAIYTASFKPSYEPLTTTTGGATSSNVKVICCNNSSITGSSLTSGTISSTNTPTASTDSPFDDPEGFKFGEGGNQNIIKTGSYVGNGSSTGPEINLGWEPQFVLWKNANGNVPWIMLDSMRGIVTDDKDPYLYPNTNGAEISGGSGDQWIDLTPTGFKVKNNSGYVNDNGDTYIYIAIRRSDGYVGKPVELGTDVFGMAYSTGTDPVFAPGFPVDFTTLRRPGTTENWTTAARLIQGKYLFTNSTAIEGSDTNIVFDYNNGFHGGTGFPSTYLSWSWKRHAGFDVVTYNGQNNPLRPDIAHNLGTVPEMYWIKSRITNGQEWAVYHKGLNGGSNPEGWCLNLNDSSSQNNAGGSFWNAPTSTHLSLKSAGRVNFNGSTYIAMLFASVDGISKVGYYAGSGSTQTITTGFQPRFLIVKVIDNTLPWYVLDTTRGWAAGNDSYLQLNENAAQVTNFDFGAPTATGFTMQGGAAANNESGLNYIYYAHA